MQAYILCGGAGTRLGSLLQGGQKAMVDVKGRPFLSLVLMQLRQAGVTQGVLCAHHRADQIEACLPDLASESGIALQLVVEPSPMGTGGAVLHALQKVPAVGRYLVLNADTYLVNSAYTLVAKNDRNTLLSIQVPDRSRYGSLECGADGRVLKILEKGSVGPGLVSAGVCGFAVDVLDELAAVPCSMEHDILPFLVKKKKLYSEIYNGPFIDIGIPESLRIFREIGAIGKTI